MDNEQKKFIKESVIHLDSLFEKKHLEFVKKNLNEFWVNQVTSELNYRQMILGKIKIED